MSVGDGPFASAAMRLAQCGLRVFPVKPGTKRCKPGFPKGASADADTVRGLVAKHGSCNIGIALGGDIVALDIDRHGSDGFAALAGLVERCGPLPPTPTHRTPGGGGGERHLFRVPQGTVRTKVQLVDGVELLTTHAVVPPSIVGNGAYAWAEGQEPWSISIAALPAPWLALVDGARPRPKASPTKAQPQVSGHGSTTAYGAAAVKSEADAVRAAPPHAGNDTLNRSAFALGQLVAGGEVERSDAESALLQTALDRGVPQREAQATIRSGLDAGQRDPRRAEPAPVGTAPVPAVSRRVLDRVQGLQAATTRTAGMGPAVHFWGPSRIIATFDPGPAPVVDPAMVARVCGVVAKLGGVDADRLLRWLVVSGFDQVRAGNTDPRCLVVPGGWTELAQRVGAHGKRAVDTVRDLVHAFAMLRFQWDSVRCGNILTCDEPNGSGPGVRKVLRIVLGTALLPGFSKGVEPGAQSQWTARDKRIVPVLPQPALRVLLPRYHPAGLQLSWLIMRALTDDAKAVATSGGIPWRKSDWQNAAARAGLDPDRLWALVDSWHDDSDGAAFLSIPCPGVLGLGPAHIQALQFIAQRHAIAERKRREARGHKQRSR